MITKDNAVLVTNAVAYINIVSPEKAVYGVEDYVLAIQTLVQTSLHPCVSASRYSTKWITIKVKFFIRAENIMSRKSNKTFMMKNIDQIRPGRFFMSMDKIKS